ncbi:unnamed protein product [Soboliphyme baturini]|uniref:G_PROTEIN_RECEP_F1_2 domain-containing protein n=1 Tax=Soboliphyme baturini TaxID=241478 RepID=A0A183IJY2_9BILA|nr:unnamed protein product [Soboliphyme baturini]
MSLRHCILWYCLAIVFHPICIDMEIVMSLDRFVAISHPLLYRRCNRKFCLALLVVISVLHGVTDLLCRILLSHHSAKIPICLLFYTGPEEVIDAANGLFYIAAIVVLILNLYVIFLALRQRRRVRQQQDGSGSANRQSWDIRIARTLTFCIASDTITRVICQILRQYARHSNDAVRRRNLGLSAELLDFSALATFVILTVRSSNLRNVMLKPLKSVKMFVIEIVQ